MEEAVIGSDAFKEQLASVAGELRRKLPPELRDLIGENEAQARETLAQLAREGMEDVLARLHTSGTDAD
jgi:hypothetical protein